MMNRNYYMAIFVSYLLLPINDTSFELSVFWPSDTESWILDQQTEVSDFVSLSFKTRLTSVTCFCRNVTYSKISSMEPETENMMT